jgi:hypothetical protein
MTPCYDSIEHVVLPLNPNVSRTASFNAKTGKSAHVVATCTMSMLLLPASILLASITTSSLLLFQVDYFVAR